MSGNPTIDKIIAAVSDPANSATRFRALTGGGGRHGIRLERAYWKSLETIAAKHGMKPAHIIDLLAASALDSKSNLTSCVRLFCLNWHSSYLSKFEAIGGERLATSLVNLSLQPAIALSSEKRLLASNETFLQLIRTSFGGFDKAALQADLRLVLDQPLVDVIEKLETNGNLPLQVGMAIGLADRRLRRNLKVILVPSDRSGIIVGFVI